MTALMTVIIQAGPAGADGTFSVAPTTLDFGEVAVGATKTIPVVITNTGATSGTPNFAGGAPIDPTNFGGSQNCAGKTFAPGDSCEFTYIFEPTTEGPLATTTTIGIDANNYPIAMSGTGTAATPTTTAPTTTTPTTGRSTGGGGNTGTTVAGSATTVAPGSPPRVEIEHDTVAPGGTESAEVDGLQPNESVSATMEPGAVALGSQVADADGTAEFTWKIDEDTALGPYEFVAVGATSGAVRAAFTVGEDDSGVSPWLIVLIVLIVAAIIAAIVYVVRKRNQSGPGDDPDATVAQPVVPPGDDPDATVVAQPPVPPEPDDPPTP
jgi:hypothetical protein